MPGALAEPVAPGMPTDRRQWASRDQRASGITPQGGIAMLLLFQMCGLQVPMSISDAMLAAQTFLAEFPAAKQMIRKLLSG